MVRPIALPASPRVLPALGLALLVASTGLSAAAARAQAQPTPLQRLRAMLGIIRPVTVGGSRGKADSLCLLSPWVQPGQQGGPPASAAGAAPPPVEAAVALTPSGAPPIATAAPLAELQILRGGTLIWRGRASSSGPLANPLAWPLAPLKPGGSVLLKLRKQQAAGADFSFVELRRPSSPGSGPTPAAAGSDPAETISGLLQQGRNAEAMETLFQADLDGNPQLRQWARATIAEGCATAR